MRWILILLALGLLLSGVYVIVSPFIIPVLWAVILTLSTWPLYRRFQALWPNHPSGSAFVMTAGLALLVISFVGPILFALSREIVHAGAIVQMQIQNFLAHPPDFSAVPIVGPYISNIPIVAGQSSELSQRLIHLAQEYQGAMLKIVTSAATQILSAVAKLFLCFFIVFFLFRDGQRIAQQVKNALHRIGGERFERLLEAARVTVRGAVYGVLFTAIAQGFLAGVGFLVAGAPVPILLGFATIVFSLIPFGTPVIYVPVAIGLMLNGSPIEGAALLAWGIGVVSTSDNFLRPYFISQATSMPILLVFFGGIGGMLSFGLIGIFLGPIILSLALVLWFEWIEGHKRANG